MPSFSYEGLNAQGQPTSGTLICNSISEAKTQLQGRHIFITKLYEGDAVAEAAVRVELPKRRRKVKHEKVVDFLRQMSTLTQAKLPLVRSLSALLEQEDDPAFKEILQAIKDKVQAGSTLADALADHPQCFSNLAVSMVRAGETGGVLEQSLLRLADFTEDEHETVSNVKAAMVYPVVLSCIMGLAVAALMIFAIPRFKAIYKDFNAELPTITQALIDVSDFLVVYWWLVLALIFVAVALIKKWLQTRQAKVMMDRLKFKLPFLGPLTKAISIARFSRTFGTLVDGGIPILSALNISKDTAGNVVIEDALDSVAKNVKEGERIAKPLRASGVFPPVVIHMISVGEESGRLGQMLGRIAESYEKQTKRALKAATSTLEPLIIVCLAGVVTLIILAMLLPMLDMNMMMQ